MDIENELTAVKLRVELTDTRDLVLFEEQDRAERQYRQIHGALMDAGCRRSAAETQAQVDLAGEFVLSAADAGRATVKSLQAQILAILRQAEGGMPVAELCREHGMSSASFYKWRAKYGGMDASLISQMKAIEDENRRLKRMYADLSMQADLLKEALGKK